MSKIIVIAENGIDKTIAADRLRTKVANGSTCDWLPEDELPSCVNGTIGGVQYSATVDNDGYIRYARKITSPTQTQIREGGKAIGTKQNALTTRLSGGGTCKWVRAIDGNIVSGIIGKNGDGDIVYVTTDAGKIVNIAPANDAPLVMKDWCSVQMALGFAIGYYHYLGGTYKMETIYENPLAWAFITKYNDCPCYVSCGYEDGWNTLIISVLADAHRGDPWPYIGDVERLRYNVSSNTATTSSVKDTTINSDWYYTIDIGSETYGSKARYGSINSIVQDAVPESDITEI